MLPSEKATKIVKERKSTYGHPADVYEKVAGMWGALFGWEVSAEDVAQALLCVKMAREKNMDYDLEFTDNVDDQAGYANVLAMIKEAHGDNS